MNPLFEKLRDAILQALPNNKKEFPLHEPLFEGNEWEYVKSCIDSGWVSSVGTYVERFEENLASIVGVRRAVAVVNGTSALHICLLLAGIRENDEVIVPTLTFIATANAVHYTRAIAHFVDVEERTLGLDPVKLNDYLKDIVIKKGQESYNKYTGRRLKAVIPMHTFGHPVDLEPLLEICDKYNLVLIEDAAESLGSYYKGKHTGSFGKISAISFNGNKILTTGGGGAILTNCDEIADMARHLTNQAKRNHRWEYIHDQIGYNYRMPNLNAALGCAQLEQLPNFLQRKRKLSLKYMEVFKDIDEVEFFKEPCFAQSNYWLNCILLRDQYIDLMDDLLNSFNKSGINVRPIWKLLHTLDIYKGNPKMETTTAEKLEKKVICIPSSAYN